MLNAYPAAAVDEVVFRVNADDLRSEMRTAEESLERFGDHDPTRATTAPAVFEFSQRGVGLWRGSNNGLKREILDAACLNRLLSG